MRIAAMLLASCAAPGLAAEPWSCHFTAACMAGLACEAADHHVTIIAADHEGQLFLSSPAGDLPAERLSDTAYVTDTGLVTLTAEGTAILTLHDAAVTSYFGHCAVLE